MRCEEKPPATETCVLDPSQPLCQGGTGGRTGKAVLACSLSMQEAKAGGSLLFTLNRDQKRDIYKEEYLSGSAGMVSGSARCS